jgi:hypothetical protein
MVSFNRIARAAALCGVVVASMSSARAQEMKSSHLSARNDACVGQLYFYSIKDRAAFEEGYRRHLSWHASQKDQLVWYAWTIESGLRKGEFVDGTFGASFAGLDARPNLSGDGADFVQNVSALVTALDTETWTLWGEPSTGIPLEDRKPEAMLDMFLLEVLPAEAQIFEGKITLLAKTKLPATRLSWYRLARGGGVARYMLLLSRNNWADVESAGSTLSEMIERAYSQTPSKVNEALQYVRSYRNETWDYEPRLTLIPGHSLQP